VEDTPQPGEAAYQPLHLVEGNYPVDIYLYVETFYLSNSIPILSTVICVTAHSGLAHLAQLTTIYMRGLLGAKHLLDLQSGS
jgi:hypothetical protein